MKKMNKMFALILVLTIALSLVIPASAVSYHTLSIDNSVSGHTYEAYQIFGGDEEIKNGELVLINITWGNGVNAANLLADLAAAFPGVYDTTMTAAQVADELSNQDLAHAKAFAAVVDKAANLGVAANSTYETDHYEFKNMPSGYYLIRETSSLTGTTMSDYIMRLTDDITIVPKDGVVSVDKYILEGEHMKDVADAVIGKPVNFELHGHLPANFREFDTFYYAFHDTMSAGITYQGNIEVEFVNGSNIQDVDPADYAVSVAVQGDGTTKLDIVFTDLIALKSKYTIHADTEVFVSYFGYLNENAIVGGTGNENEVFLEYSNDPTDTSHGTTVPSEVHVFTFSLDLLKIDGSITSGDNTLANVGFKLYDDVTGTIQWAVMDYDSVNNKYIIKSWTPNEADGTQFLTGAGGTVNIKGLDVGTYYLKETAPLSGYNPVADIEFAIAADYNTTAQSLNSLSITYGSVYNQAGNLADGSVDMTVVNNPGAELPSTGGIGTTIFYILGGLMATGAAVLLITKKRMAS